MAATTLDVIMDRVRSLCFDTPFEYTESFRFDSMELEPVGTFDGAFRVEGQSGRLRGMFDYKQEREDLLTVTVSQAINADYDNVRRLLTKTAHSLTAAVVRDGETDSGLYSVPDKGQSFKLSVDSTDAYVLMKLTLPVNYEANL
jgi:hypothetical protein